MLECVEALLSVDGQMFICADHGNAEQLLDYNTGEPFTAHTTNQYHLYSSTMIMIIPWLRAVA